MEVVCLSTPKEASLFLLQKAPEWLKFFVASLAENTGPCVEHNNTMFGSCVDRVHNVPFIGHFV